MVGEQVSGAGDDPRTDRGLDRRTFVALAGAAAAGLAGCSNERDEGDRTTARERDDRDALSVMTAAIPSSVDLGPVMSQPTGRAHLLGLFHSLVLPVHGPTGAILTSGHSWTVDGTELSVPCAVEAYETDGESCRYVFDDRLTYWNGEALDGRAYYRRDRLEWLSSYGALEEREFESELASDAEYRRSLGDSTSRYAARLEIHPGMPPLPPSFTGPWIEQFEDASTREAVRSTYLDYKQGKLGVEAFADEGYGTGRYEVRSGDDVTTGGLDLPMGLESNVEFVYASPREDYPGPGDLPTLRVVGGAGGVSGVSGAGGIGTSNTNPADGSGGSGRPAGSLYDPRDFVAGGEIDFGVGEIARRKADFYRDSTPDEIEQLATWPNPAGGGLQLTFNWANDHLRRLWVRRALVAAAPLERMRLNQYGKGTAAPNHHTGMLSRADEAFFEPSFLDSLYDYPLAADTERAAAWLEEGGYERVDGRWTGPDGDPLSLTLTVYSTDVAEVQTFVAGLESFGVAVETRQLLGGGIDFAGNVRQGAFDVILTSVPGGWSPAASYNDWFAVGDGWVSMPPIAVSGNPLGTCRDDPPQASVPTEVSLPEAPGALRVDGADYPDGGATYERSGAGETVDVCAAVDRLREPGIDESAFREAARRCARWYNYALPNAVFVQDTVGLWADLADYSAPQGDADVLRAARQNPAAPELYHLQAGTVRAAER